LNTFCGHTISVVPYVHRKHLLPCFVSIHRKSLRRLCSMILRWIGGNISSASKSQFHAVHFWKAVRTYGVFFIQRSYWVFGFKRDSWTPRSIISIIIIPRPGAGRWSAEKL
jgi:hypothetical protein